MSRTEENKLEDCPFCGAPDDGGVRVATETGSGLAVAYCRECEAQGPHTQGVAASVAAWNKPAKRAAELKLMGDRVAESYVAETLITAELRKVIIARDAELKAVCEELGKMKLAYEMSEALRSKPESSTVSWVVADDLMNKLSTAEREVVARMYAKHRNRAASAEMELAECKKLAIATLCDDNQGHEGPGGTLERVIALAKECNDLTSQSGETGAAFRDLCLAVEAEDTQAINAIVDAKWRGPEQS